MAISKNLTALSCALVLFISLVPIATGIWMRTSSSGAECVQFLRTPLIIVGSVMFVVALAGFVGAVNAISWLLYVYLAVIFVGMWTLLGFTVFAFVVTNKSASAMVSNRGVGTYRTADFSSWLQEQVDEQAKWAPIRACLAGGNTCQFLNSLNATDPAAIKLSPIQAGCCYPPDACNASALVSRVALPPSATPPAESPLSSPLVNNLPPNASDCSLYGSDPSRLCYGCDSCKAGFLQTIHEQWRMVARISLGVVLLLFVLYTVGCCAYRTSKKEESFFGRV